MWIYRSPIGILKIVRQPDGTFGLCHNETVWEGLRHAAGRSRQCFLSCNRL